MDTQTLRQTFLNYFHKNGHDLVASSSLVPHDDPTLLFANAGMNQFKDYFVGKTTPHNPKATSAQKCVRAGGKHNDLENVGFTARHHTFFEMLGNFSFGDYFKREAIEYAWAFLVDELKIPAEKLLITVHHSDKEAFEIWNKKIGIPQEKIFFKDDKDNFWEMGETGPCGPCSEIFYDHGSQFSDPRFKPSKTSPLIDDEGRYVEIWNLVFMQFEKRAGGKKADLPNPSIDTGAGLERMAAVLQGVYWNYDIDIFQPIYSKLKELSGHDYHTAQNNLKSSMRVVADHIRASSMLITDGVLPSNEGRGYVLRRIIRRAIRHLKELGIKDVAFYRLCDAVFESLGNAYPDNMSNLDLAKKTLEAEEKKFLETLDHGLKYLNESLKKDMRGKTLSGHAAFKLYDTFGFPLDLTEVILKEKGLSVDTQEFDQSMAKQKEQSKKSWKGGTQEAGIEKELFQLKDQFGETKFVGYERLSAKAKLLEKIDQGGKTLLLFDQTPFYGESGGQAGDRGKITKDGKVLTEIIDTQKPLPHFHLHVASSGNNFVVGESYKLEVDHEKRELTKRNHSATHLLQSALIEVLGSHVKQAGSSVNFEKLRFDFTNQEALSQSQLDQVEMIVNQKIQASLPVEANEMSMDQARKKGALAFFGEKYGDKVRVLDMGGFSIELCGGTHVHNTSEISLFKILSESSLSSGVRRIEATTSQNALNYLQKRSDTLKSIETLLSSSQTEVFTKVQNLISKVKELKKAKGQPSNQSSLEIKETKNLDRGFELQLAEVPQGSDLRNLSDKFINKSPKGILLLYSQESGKATILLRTNKKNKQIDCKAVFQSAIQTLEGRGGGRLDMAQGSGNFSRFSDFVSTIQELLIEQITSS